MKWLDRLLIFFSCFVPLYGAEARFRLCLRLREYFRIHRMTFWAKCMKSYLLKRYGCELSINARISPKAEFMHTIGIIIGEGVIVSSGVKLYGNITLGRKDVFNEMAYPFIDENVILCNGCSVLGKIIVGKNSIIGAKSLVIKDVEPNSVYIGSPAKRIK